MHISGYDRQQRKSTVSLPPVPAVKEEIPRVFWGEIITISRSVDHYEWRDFKSVKKETVGINKLKTGGNSLYPSEIIAACQLSRDTQVEYSNETNDN
jgi:hypothetical protein